MRIQIFGDEAKSKLLALHPMLADGASMVQLAGHLREDYCIIAPDLSGQGKDTGTFESAEKEAETLYAYLKEKGWLDIKLVYGASLGAAVGLELLPKPELKVYAAVFDGCPLYRNAPVLRWLLTKVFLKKHRKAVSNPGLSVKKMTELYGPVFGPSMGRTFETMSEASIQAIVAACSKCSFPQYPKELERNLHFEYGSKDSDLKIGKKNIARYYPNATLNVREGYGHCQYMSSLGERYGEVLEAYFTGAYAAHLAPHS